MGQPSHSCQGSRGLPLTVGGWEEETTYSMECISTNIMEKKTSPLEDLKIRRPKKSGPFLVFLPRGIKGQKLPARLEQNALRNQKPMLQLSGILRVTFHKLTLDSEARFKCHYCLPTFEVRLRKPRLLSLEKKKKTQEKGESCQCV